MDPKRRDYDFSSSVSGMLRSQYPSGVEGGVNRARCREHVFTSAAVDTPSRRMRA